MFESVTPADRSLAIQRLTALWALNECGLGGFLHAIQSPFTGLLVGSIAMICIALISAFALRKWQSVMTALVIVLIIKALVSPHSTPTAYIAVIFQAVTGAIIYRYIPGLLFSSVLFVVLGLVESAFQRLLTLTILYGNSLWEAIDIWGDVVTKKWGVIIPLSSSRLVIYTYLAIHVVAGILIGWFIYKVIRSIDHHWGESRFQLQLGKEDTKSFQVKSRSNLNWKRYLLFVVMVLLIVFAYTVNLQGSDTIKGLLSVLRAIVILVTWFVFIAPLVMKALRRFLQKKHQQLAVQVEATMDIIPQLLWILDRAWKETRQLSFVRRWKSFLLHALLYILQYKNQYDTDTHRTDAKP